MLRVCEDGALLDGTSLTLFRANSALYATHTPRVQYSKMILTSLGGIA